MTKAEYSIYPARYAKGKMVIVAPSVDGFQSRAARLAQAKGIGGRYVNRSHGYVVSKSAAAKFEALFLAGADASCWTGEIMVAA